MVDSLVEYACYVKRNSPWRLEPSMGYPRGSTNALEESVKRKIAREKVIYKLCHDFREPV